MVSDKLLHALEGVGKENTMDESNIRGGAFNIKEQRFQVRYFLAMSEPV